MALFHRWLARARWLKLRTTCHRRRPSTPMWGPNTITFQVEGSTRNRVTDWKKTNERVKLIHFHQLQLLHDFCCLFFVSLISQGGVETTALWDASTKVAEAALRRDGHSGNVMNDDWIWTVGFLRSSRFKLYFKKRFRNCDVFFSENNLKGSSIKLFSSSY